MSNCLPTKVIGYLSLVSKYCTSQFGSRALYIQLYRLHSTHPSTEAPPAMDGRYRSPPALSASRWPSDGESSTL